MVHVSNALLEVKKWHTGHMGASFLGVPNVFLGYTNFSGIQKTIFGRQNAFFRDTKSFFGKQKFLVDKNPRTSQKIQKFKNNEKHMKKKE